MKRNNLNLKDHQGDTNNAEENINRDVCEVFLGMMPSDSVVTQSDLEELKQQTKRTFNYMRHILFDLKKQLDEVKNATCKCKCSKAK